MFIFITTSLLYVLISRHAKRTGEITRKLREREEFLHSVATNVPGAIYEFYATDKGEYGLNYVSERAEELFGMPSDQATFFSDFTSRIVDEDRPGFLESIRQAVEARAPWTFVGRLTKTDGALMWFHGRSIPQREEDRVLFRGVLLDVTEQKQAEEILCESETAYRMMFDLSPNAIVLCTLDGVHVDVNRKFLELAGLSASEVLGKTIQELGTLSLEHQKEFIRQIRKGSGEMNQLEARVWSRSTETWHDVLISARMIPVRGETMYLSIINDITELKKAMEELSQARALLESAVSQSPSGILIADAPDVKIRFANAAAFGIRGETDKPLTEIDVEKHSHLWQTFMTDGVTPYPPEKLPLSRAILEGVTTRSEEVIIRRDDGEGRWVSANASPVRDSHGNIVAGIVIFHDITELKRSEEQKRKLEAQLVQAQKMESIGTLAGGIAHDFNNILAAILGYSELAMDDLEKPDKARSELREVIKAADRARNLVGQILTFSRRKEISYSPMELPPLIRESLTMIRSVIPSTIEILQDIADTGLIMSDPTQMHQLVMNLCTNAAHAMDETGGTLKVSLRKAVIEPPAARELDITPGPYLHLTVSDTGLGMPPEVVDRIVEPYFTTKEQGRGTGLGLSVVHGIVKSQKGAILCRSAPGKGTAFDVYLPEIVLRKPAEEPLDGLPVPGGTERILFVDDEPMLTTMVEEILGKLGYRIVTLTNSLDALSLFQHDPGKFDLVISDMTMPGMTGDKLAGRMMEIRPDIPVILCTGYSDHITEQRAKEMGIRDFMMKPLELRDLAVTIRSVLDQG
jgi:PAS domain S-box-containing protein